MITPKIREVTVRDQTQYMISLNVDGRRVRKYFRTTGEAEKFLRARAKDEADLPQEFLRFDLDERLGMARIMVKIKARKLTLEEVWEGYLAYERDVLAGKPTLAEITLKDAIRLYVQEGERLNHRESSLVAKEGLLNQFARGREALLMSKINPELCQAWFTARGGHRRATLAAEKGKLNAWFGWAQKNGYMQPGTVMCPTPVSGIKLPIEDKKEPEILTPAQAKTLISFTAETEPAALIFVTLALFSGIRPDEIHRLTFANIRLADKKGDVVLSKIRKPRTVPIPANALAWLELAKAKGHWGQPEDAVAPTRMAMNKIRARLRTVLPGQKWMQDVLRHSCATYRFQQCQSWNVVAKELGNSPAVLETNYLADVEQKDMEEFSSILPP